MPSKVQMALLVLTVQTDKMALQVLTVQMDKTARPVLLVRKVMMVKTEYLP